MEQILEYFGVATGLLYLFLEIKQHRSMWIVGFLTSLIYVFVFFFSRFYADMSLQIYYVLISIYGFIQWTRTNLNNQKQANQTDDVIYYQHLGLKKGLLVFAAIGLLFAGIRYILIQYTDSPLPAGDALTTAVGIVATWMLARRIIEHWYFWIVINLLSAYLYYIRGLYPTLFLYLCYALLAVAGLYLWKKKGIKQNEDTL